MNSFDNYTVYKKLYALAVLVILLLYGEPILATSYQTVSLSPGEINKSINSQWDVSVLYNVSTGDNTLTGIGIRIHYDSSKLEFIESKNIALGSASGMIEPEDETSRKADNDIETDKVVIVAWYSTSSLFPNQPLPFKLMDMTFKVKTGISASNTSINVTFSSTPTGFEGKAENASVHITTMPTVSWTTAAQAIAENMGSVDITAQLSYSSDLDITIPVTVSGTADLITDHNFSNQSITIISGQLTATKTISIVNDNLIEDDETIILTMGTPNNSLVDIPFVQTITIQNDDNGHFTTPIIPTPSSMMFYGDNFMINGQLADIGDEIGVFDPDDVICGRVIIEEQGMYMVTVYADDASTTSVDEGADVGDELTFKVWDVSNNAESIVSQSMFIPEDVYGISASPHSPPQWTAANDRWGLNLQITSSQEIPLRAGWNLFSFSVNKVFYDSTTPPSVETLSNAEFVKLNSLNDVLTSIEGQYDIIRNFDANGAQTFDPNVPSFFNTLHYIASGYGYWIKMNQASTLVLSGSRANPSDKLLLRSGWNLIGSWHSAAQYDSVTPPSVSLPGQVLTQQVDALKDVFLSIDGSYAIIRNFDENGSGTYDPFVPSFFNTLHYISPGYGYWIKINESKEFNY